MQRVIGMDIHRTLAEVAFWEAGRLRSGERVDMTRSGLEGFGRSLSKEDEVVVEATGNAMAVVRVLSPYVGFHRVGNRYEDHGARSSGWGSFGPGVWCDHPGRGAPEHVSGQADPY